LSWKRIPLAHTCGQRGRPERFARAGLSIQETELAESHIRLPEPLDLSLVYLVCRYYDSMIAWGLWL